MGLKNNETARILREIADAENVAGAHEAERFFMFFDLKDGISLRSLNEITNEETRNWISTKLSKYGDFEKGFEMPGFGRPALSKVIAAPGFPSGLRSHISTSTWQRAFGGLFHCIYWILMAANPQYTI